ncbi:MAG: efflux RND transporter periplasmic adaptor subunit [Candidatus Pacebacteria bacterium]|nr:efflux RND transporter periplasmic adaptor subunit [Candidatus Paceibacterota bacterium]
MNKTKLISAFLISAMILLSCSKTEENPGKKNESVQNPAVTVKVEVIQPRDLQLYAEITGKLEGITDIVYYSEVAGKVKSVEKGLGDKIRNGEAIAYLDSENYKITYDQARSELKSSEAGLEVLTIKLETTQKLYESGKVSKFELTNDQSALKKAEAAVEGARANVERARINYENSKFLSPVDGSIAQLHIKQGQFIATGQPVASIVDCRQLVIKTGVTEYDIQAIKTGAEVEIRHNGSDEIIYGKVTGSGKKPDATGNYPVEIVIENEGMELIPGMIVRGRIESRRIGNVIYTDFDNIIEEFGNYFVYLVNSENKAVKRKIEPGKKYGNSLLILSGVEPGEKIVVSGVDALTDNAQVKIYGNDKK